MEKRNSFSLAGTSAVLESVITSFDTGLDSQMKFPRWLVSFFFDPEFDAQMQKYDEGQDLRRLRRVRFAPVARPGLADEQCEQDVPFSGQLHAR